MDEGYASQSRPIGAVLRPACGFGPGVVDRRGVAAGRVGETLDRIEDEFSGIPWGDGTWDDGRMYAPRLDNRRAVSGRPDLVRDRSKNHNTYYSTSGAILIVTIEGKVEFSKAGLDGREIEL